MPNRKNVIVFYTDQQRADSLGCMGNSLARTPNIDGLAAHGICYKQHYAANPVCMPSRAAFITGRYPQANGVLDNGVPLPLDQLTMPEVFRQNGYHTACFGKLHFQTYKSYPDDTSMESMQRWASGELDDWHGPYYGFDTVEMTSSHGEACSGHYGRWRAQHFPNLKLGPDNAHGNKNFPQLSSYKSNLPLEAHHSTWVADRAIDFLNDYTADAPFYLHVSFPDPHHPFTPPAPYYSLFDAVLFPPPHAVAGENDNKPKPYRDAMIGNPFPGDGEARHWPELAGEAFQQVVAHTCGMVALIDDCIGRVITKLDQLGLRENTILVFTSDHGDFLGDHHFLLKGQLPCRSLLHVPLIIVDPDDGYRAETVDAVGSNIDIMPTLLEWCGLNVPETVQGVSLPKPGQTPQREYAFAAGWSKASPLWQHYTIYKQDWRITIFPRLRDGELYDLKDDPFEHQNLIHNPLYADVRQTLTEELLFAVGDATPPYPPVVTDW